MLSLRTLAAALSIAIGWGLFQGQAAFAFAGPSAEVGAIRSFAKRQIDKRFRLGADGLRRYDCSGLVYRTYFESGLLKKVGGTRKRARGYYRWFKRRGLASRSNPRPGDLVVWGYKGHPVKHIGIFIGWNKRGRPVAISALINPWGVSRHRVHALPIPFRAYLHVNLAG